MKFSVTLALAAVLAAMVGCSHTQKSTDSTAANVPRLDAEKIALSKVPNGTIREGELETENGLRVWSFDIARPGTEDVTEVQVDANTGAVVSVKIESAKDEAAEKSGEPAK